MCGGGCGIDAQFVVCHNSVEGIKSLLIEAQKHHFFMNDPACIFV
jgi:hypothetical protein